MVWERLSVRWPEALRGFAQALADVAAASLSATASVGPGDEVFALPLVIELEALGTVKMLLFAGLQAARERILADPDADPELVEDYLWGCQDPERESVVAVVALRGSGDDKPPAPATIQMQTTPSEPAPVVVPAPVVAPKSADNYVCWAPLDDTDGPGV